MLLGQATWSGGSMPPPGGVISEDYCNKIRCGLITHEQAGLENVYACSQKGYIGAWAGCAPFMPARPTPIPVPVVPAVDRLVDPALINQPMLPGEVYAGGRWPRCLDRRAASIPGVGCNCHSGGAGSTPPAWLLYASIGLSVLALAKR